MREIQKRKREEYLREHPEAGRRCFLYTYSSFIYLFFTVCSTFYFFITQSTHGYFYIRLIIATMTLVIVHHTTGPPPMPPSFKEVYIKDFLPPEEPP